MNSRLIGGVLAGIVMLGVVGTLFWKRTEVERQPIAVHIIATKEAVAFCQNPAALKIMKDKYNRVPTCDQDSSSAIGKKKDPKELVGVDILWPASDVVARTYKGPKIILVQAFPSQPVGFTKTEHADAFVRAGLARKDPDGSYTLLVAQFVKAMDARKTWRDIGIDSPGRLKVRTTDVRATSSGQGFANLLATIYNGGDPATAENVEALAAKIKPHVESMGHLPMTSSDLLRECLMTGCFELNIGFENSYIRTARESKEFETIMSDKLRILYLEPSLWGFHTMIVLTENGKKFADILANDPDLRLLAWTDHGFRTGTTGITGDATKVPVKGIRPSVGVAINWATPEVNDMLIKGVAP